MDAFVDHYATLELSRSATAAQIRKAYHRLALLHHPDKQRSLTLEALAANEERFKEIAYAWEILGDPEQRASYDAGRASWGFRAVQRDSRSVFREFFGGGAEHQTYAAETANGCVVEIKLPEDVFNVPLFEGYLVLDPRPAAVRNAGAPVLWSSLAAETAAADFPAWVRANADEFCHERESPIIVLGEPGGVVLAESLACFFNATPDTVVDSGSTDSSVATIDRLRSRCKKIWLVRGGTVAITECYPLLSATWHVEQMPTPHQVAPGLYLGSRAVPLTNAHLQRGLGITHMIVAADTDLGEIGEASVDGRCPIKLLRCAVADDENAQMQPVWSAACSFINEALQQQGEDEGAAMPGCVMLCLHGRSRSASIALAWLARAHSLPVSMAAAILQQKCDRVDWSLCHPPQLIAWLAEASAQLTA
jgi:hypothetical protein